MSRCRTAPYLDLADVIEAECKRLHVQPILFTERLPHRLISPPLIGAIADFPCCEVRLYIMVVTIVDES